MIAIGTGNLVAGWILSFIRTLVTPLKTIANNYNLQRGSVCGGAPEQKTKQIFKGGLGPPKKYDCNKDEVKAESKQKTNRTVLRTWIGLLPKDRCKQRI